MDIRRQSQRTLNNVPVAVTGRCPECSCWHEFELIEEGLIPEGLKAETTNDAAPIYEASCPATVSGLVRVADCLMETDW